MNEHLLMLIYGMATMFYALTSVGFYLRRSLLHNMVAFLMAVLSLECIKDVAIIFTGNYNDPYFWTLASILDLLVVPVYVYVLHLLLCANRISALKTICHYAPFVLLIAAFAISGNELFADIIIIYTTLYGSVYFVWSLISIPKYQAMLKQQYSYSENISLKWLRTIPVFFYIMLALWIANMLFLRIDIDIIYLSLGFLLWIVISYFLYKHESVLEDLQRDAAADAANAVAPNDLASRITDLFSKQKFHLNPNLKISDVAREVGSNRTYVSNFFNRDAGATFYDYVNNLRIEHACHLLRSTSLTIADIAQQSGFNSSQAFIRVFVRIKGITPSEHRAANT